MKMISALDWSYVHSCLYTTSKTSSTQLWESYAANYGYINFWTKKISISLSFSWASLFRTCTFSGQQCHYPPCFAVQDKVEKDFILRHAQTVFELLDEDGSTNISADEFEGFSFLFNFEAGLVRQVFDEFDVSGNQVGKVDMQY